MDGNLKGFKNNLLDFLVFCLFGVVVGILVPICVDFLIGLVVNLFGLPSFICGGGPQVVPCNTLFWSALNPFYSLIVLVVYILVRIFIKNYKGVV